MTIRILPIHFHILDTTKDAILIERDPSILDLKNSFVETLNKYLPNLQRLREDTVLKTSARFDKAFTDDIHGEPHHWYIFNSGGLNEIQYNVGMSPDMIRYGLGMFLGKRKNVNPQVTENYYKAFCTVIKNDRTNFDRFVHTHEFKLEWGAPKVNGIVPNAESPDVTEDLLSIKEKHPDLEWLFVGKILKCADPEDAKLIYDPVALDRSVKSVFRDLWEYYKQTQEEYTITGQRTP